MASSTGRSSERQATLRDLRIGRDESGRLERNRRRILSHALEALEARQLLFGGTDVLVNNNNGASGTGFFTQSETSIIAWDNNVVIGFNDSGSNAAGGAGPTEGGDPGGGSAGFTGWSRSTNGGVSFTDGGGMPEAVGGNAGDPVLARNSTTGRVYHATLGFTVSTIRVFRSDDNAATWQPAITGTPGGSSEDKQWMAVDNNVGAGNGNVYLISRRFGGTTGMYFHRSIDQGATFTTGLQLWSGATAVQGGYVVVGPDHSVYAFALVNNSTYQMRKSTDGGLTFAAAITISPAGGGGVNGDLALTGMRNGLGTFSTFRSNGFANFAVNPVSGHLYGVYANNPATADKADIQMIMSTNGGATWSPPVRVNDDVGLLDQWQPTLAVTPDGTRMGVFYYSRQNDAANNTFRYWGRLATINAGVVTFGVSEPISDVQSLPEFGRDSLVNTVYMGDYDSAAATNDAFHVVWSDSRSLLPGGGTRMDPNVYYDKIPIGIANGIWDGGGDGINWTDANNWSNNVLPGVADDVVINVVANPSIILNGAQSVRSVTSQEALTINGTLSVALPSSFTGAVNLNGGTITGAGNVTFNNTFTWNGGTLSGAGNVLIPGGIAMNITGPGASSATRAFQINGTATLSNGGNRVLVLTSVAFGGPGRLDLNDNDFILNYTGGSQLTNVRNLIISGRAGGLWNGPGILSTAAKNSVPANKMLGLMEALEYKTTIVPGATTFDGVSIDNDAILVKFTYYGDADFNGVVNFDDYSRTDGGFLNSRSGWTNGDYNLDGTVNFDDYALIDGAFLSQSGPPLRPQQAPTPQPVKPGIRFGNGRS